MIEELRVCAVIAGAGSSSRMGFDKLMYKIDGLEVARMSTAAMENNTYIDEIIYVAGDNIDDITEIFARHPVNKPFRIIRGGASRQISVKLGVEAAKNSDIVAVHDGARPFVSDSLISNVIEAALEHGGAAPALNIKDTIKIVDNENFVVSTPARDCLRGVQTPQVFKRELYMQALNAVESKKLLEITDDCSLFEAAGFKVFLCPGEEENIKITTIGDIVSAVNKAPRIGHGYDVHRLVEGRRLIIGGVDIPFEKGLLGHSDADVLLHAISDALLGAAALGDIGKHFPDTDDKYKDANSLYLLHEVVKLVKDKGYRIVNIDATILCQRPKLKDFIDDMRSNIATAACCGKGSVSVKATTEEGLGYVGRSEGIAVHCVVLIK